MKKLIFLLFLFNYSFLYADDLPDQLLDSDSQSLRESIGGEEEFSEEEEKFSADQRLRFYPKSPETGRWQLASFTERTRLRRIKGDGTQEVGWLVNRHKDDPAVNTGNFFRYELIKYWLKAENTLGLNKIVLGNYELQYNQGLVFYAPYLELVRPWQIRARGILEEKGTNRNAYLFGAAGQKDIGPWQIDGFYSRKKMDSPKNDDDSADFDLRADTKNSLPLNTSNSIERYRELEEKLAGGKIEYRWQKNSWVNVLGYTAYYTPEIRPDTADEILFQGAKNTVLGLAGKQEWNEFQLAGEYAKNLHYGQAWTSGLFWQKKPLNFWLLVWNYSPDYQNPYASGITSYGRRDGIFNEAGQTLGMEYKTRINTFNIYFRPAKSKIPQRTENIVDNSAEWRANYRYSFYPGWEILTDYQNLDYDVNRNPDYPFSATSKGLDLEEKIRRNQYQLNWQANPRWKFSFHTDFKHGEFPALGQKTVGHLYKLETKYKPYQPLTINLRAIYFNSPELKISDIEPFWPNVYLPTFWVAQGKGQRYLCQITQKFFSQQIWLQYEITLYAQKTEKQTRAGKLQWDWKW